jgi:phosphoribosylamine--glycine ligase
MKVLVVGNGGREHALAWKLAQSANVHHVCVAPGNAGTGRSPKMSNANIAVDDVDGLIAFVREADVGLTVIGPEAPLVAGIVDRFEAEGLRCFGPNAKAAQLEGSKAFTKDFLARHQIPTAAYESFTDLDAASAYIQRVGAPIVVKADGLAAGKGVVVASTVDEALKAAADMLSDRAFGEAGARIVIEEFLAGEEASFIALVDGEHILPLASSQDHKARDDGDLGPNTGGMGAYSPAPVLNAQVHHRVMQRIVEPTVAGLARDGIHFRGFLYAGLMVDDDSNPRVLEFNCRMGDPETQPIMMRLQSDLLELIDAAIDGKLDSVVAQWDPRTALGVVLAAGGYPGEYAIGDVINGLLDVPAVPDVRVFHAGTRSGPNGIQTNGGRVLCVCALGDTVSQAQATAYAHVETISWEGMLYRSDIGAKAIAREQEKGPSA